MQNRSYSLYRNENPIVREAYSMLAGNIYMDSEKKELKTLVVTSTEPKIGKTSVASSLAITMAIWGKKTVLIDADMRKTIGNKQQNTGSINGLYQLLQGNTNLEDVFCPTNIENLLYVPSGRGNGNPLGLLCSVSFMELVKNIRNSFDYIIFDTPPLDSVSDATIIASKADAALLVARMGDTKIEAVKNAKEQLEKYNSQLLGVILNEVDKKDYKRCFKSYKYFNNENKQSNKDRKLNRGVIVTY